jgi:hypothetical protein
MEFLKSNVTIDPNYKPSLDMSYMDYFNRALSFSQTNYHDQIQKVINTKFNKISPTNFYEEYAWTLYSNSAEGPIKDFPPLSKELSPFYHSFWDLNNFPKVESVKNNIMKVMHDEKKFEALYRCADIINRGIKLFGWDNYRNNYLDCPEKLSALPMIGFRGAYQLSRNIGVTTELISSDRLYHLAEYWKFESPTALCVAIQKYVPMQLKIIELILWYASATFQNS